MVQRFLSAARKKELQSDVRFSASVGGRTKEVDGQLVAAPVGSQLQAVKTAQVADVSGFTKFGEKRRGFTPTTPIVGGRGVNAPTSAGSIQEQAQKTAQESLMTRRQEFITTEAGKFGREPTIGTSSDLDRELRSLQTSIRPDAPDRIKEIEIQKKFGLSTKEFQDIKRRAGELQIDEEELAGLQREGLEGLISTRGGGGASTEIQISRELGLEPGQSIERTVGPNGEDLFNVVEDTVERDAKTRADTITENQKQDAIKDTLTSFNAQEEAVRQGGTIVVRGKTILTPSAQDKLGKLSRQKKQAIDRIERDVALNLEANVLNEEARQAQVESQIEAQESPGKQITRLQNQAILDRATKIQSQNPDLDFASALAVAKKQISEAASPDDLQSLDDLQSFQRANPEASLGDIFGEARRLSGNDNVEANDLMERALSKEVADAAQDEFVARNFSTTDIAVDKAMRSTKALQGSVFEQEDPLGASITLGAYKNALDDVDSTPDKQIVKAGLRDVISRGNPLVKQMAQDMLDDLQETTREDLDVRGGVKEGFVQIIRQPDGTAKVVSLSGGGVSTGSVRIPRVVLDEAGVAQIQETTDPVVAAKARQILDGFTTLDDVKKDTSKKKMIEVGTELARLRQEGRIEGEQTPIQKQAQDLLVAFNVAGTSQEKINTQIGVSNPVLKAEFNKLVAEQGGKRVFGRDSETIADINTQISALIELIDPKRELHEEISGIFQGGKIPFGARLDFGDRGDALTLISSVLSSQTLNALAEAKGRGITFGALSEGELGLVRAAAGRLAARAITDTETGEITGFKGSEAAFLRDTKLLIEKLEKSVVSKTGEAVQQTPKPEQITQQDIQSAGIDLSERTPEEIELLREQFPDLIQ